MSVYQGGVVSGEFDCVSVIIRSTLLQTLAADVTLILLPAMNLIPGPSDTLSKVDDH